MIARALGKTHAEFMHGTSNVELVHWKQLYAIEAQDRKDAK